MKTCSIDGCERSFYCRTWCRIHYFRWYKHGDPLMVKKSGPPFGRTGPSSPLWRGDDVTYNRAHKRLRETRGSAADYPCAHCENPARNWSYDNAAPDERVAAEGRFSPDPEHYIPLCLPCHRKFDSTHREAIA